MDFATLDDSLVYDKNLFVYSHALILSDDKKYFKIYSGNNKEIYTNEKELSDFIRINSEGFTLYSCNHYKMYNSIWNKLVFEGFHKKLPKLVKNQFLETHNLAKKIAKEKFNELKTNNY